MNNGGGQGFGPDEMDLMFSPAEHTEGMKRRKERKRRERAMKASKTSPPVEVEPDLNTSNVTLRASGSNGHPILNLPDDDEHFDCNASESQRALAATPTRAMVVTPSRSPAVVTPTRSAREPPSQFSNTRRESRPRTPPPLRPTPNNSSPTRNSESEDLPHDCDDDDVWYEKWWMLCCADLKRS